MAKRSAISPEVSADVLISARRRCCICYSLGNDASEKSGQIAHIDRDSSNSSRDNLVFLCLEHHDRYDSRTSQSKGITPEELRGYQAQLDRFVTKSLPSSDSEVARALLAALDRPAFRTPFRQESSLPRFRVAITEAIATINTGKMDTGPAMQTVLDDVVRQLVALRAAFDALLREGEIRPCGCQDPNCPVYMMSYEASREMDNRRQLLLDAALKIDPKFPASFYDIR